MKGRVGIRGAGAGTTDSSIVGIARSLPSGAISGSSLHPEGLQRPVLRRATVAGRACGEVEGSCQGGLFEMCARGVKSILILIFRVCRYALNRTFFFSFFLSFYLGCTSIPLTALPTCCTLRYLLAYRRAVLELLGYPIQRAHLPAYPAHVLYQHPVAAAAAPALTPWILSHRCPPPVLLGSGAARS